MAIKPSFGKLNKKQFIFFGIAFGIIGAALLLKSFAAGPLASLEAENATLSAPAVACSDAAASGGKFIKFGGTCTTSGGGGNTSLTTPIRAAFYYPWFPETWYSDDNYHPSLGNYDSSNQTVVDTHIHALDYDKVRVGIASWWGQGTHSENTRIPLLLSRTQALGSSLKWTLYYEKEGSGDPTVTEIQGDLSYIKANYATSSSYAYVNNKPVIFVYADANDGCAMADRWKQANTLGFYVVLKVFSGYKTCASQPDSWHQYGPAVATDSQAGYSYSISPGFWLHGTATPTLARDVNRWTTNVQSMVASNAPWQLITTFNEWGESSAVESAVEWPSASGFGVYQDVLHNN